MRCVDDRDAFACELAHDLEQRVALRGRQRRGRLVHDEDACIERQCPGDLDELLLADAQAGNPGVRRDRYAEACQQLARPLSTIRRRSISTPPISGSRPRKILSATLSSGTRLSSWWMMATPASSASRTPLKDACRPSTRMDAVVARVYAGKDLHQSAPCRHRSRPSARALRLGADRSRRRGAPSRRQTIWRPAPRRARHVRSAAPARLPSSTTREERGAPFSSPAPSAPKCVFIAFSSRRAVSPLETFEPQVIVYCYLIC